MTEPTIESAAERVLDQAIEFTFPASDPIAVEHAFLSARRRDRKRAAAPLATTVPAARSQSARGPEKHGGVK
jgi:hypothetical protein